MRIENGASGRGQRYPKPDLAAVLLHYGVDAHHSGNYTCVVHDETRASMSVNLEEQVVQCFSCGFAGDAFNIIMKREGYDFKRAAEASAQFESAPSDRGREAVQGVLGRSRPGVSGRKGDSRSRRWERPW